MYCDDGRLDSILVQCLVSGAAVYCDDGRLDSILIQCLVSEEWMLSTV